MVGTVLVTGANRGLGLEFARQYAADGWRVHACCRNLDHAADLARLAHERGAALSPHVLDVTDWEGVRRLADHLRAESLDVLINNAGVYGPEPDAFGETDPDAWMEVFRVNAIAPLKLAEAFADHVARSGRKTIATVTSLMGSIEDNSSGGHYAYRSSKAAVNMATRSMALDLRAKGVIAVVLNPGWVRTDMGGPSAPLSARDSVSGMRRVLAGLTLRDSGLFFDHDGERLPW